MGCIPVREVDRLHLRPVAEALASPSEPPYVGYAICRRMLSDFEITRMSRMRVVTAGGETMSAEIGR